MKVDRKRAPDVPRLLSRHDAADELLRIYEQRKTDYPRLVAEKRLTQAEADARNEALLTAWAMVLNPRLEAAGRGIYDTAIELAIYLIDARRAPSRAEVDAWLAEREREAKERERKRKLQPKET